MHRGSAPPKRVRTAAVLRDAPRVAPRRRIRAPCSSGYASPRISSSGLDAARAPALSRLRTRRSQNIGAADGAPRSSDVTPLNATFDVASGCCASQRRDG